MCCLTPPPHFPKPVRVSYKSRFDGRYRLLHTHARAQALLDSDLSLLLYVLFGLLLGLLYGLTLLSLNLERPLETLFARTCLWCYIYVYIMYNMVSREGGRGRGGGGKGEKGGGRGGREGGRKGEE